MNLEKLLNSFMTWFLTTARDSHTSQSCLLMLINPTDPSSELQDERTIQLAICRAGELSHEVIFSMYSLSKKGKKDLTVDTCLPL